MKDLDFRVGDKVWDIRHSNGYVIETDEKIPYSILVEFGNNRNIGTKSYTSDGKTHRSDLFRSLYHGHDLKVVGEQTPKREVWVNLWWDSEAEKIIGVHYFYKTEGLAYEDSVPKKQGNLTYIKTIQIEIPHS